MKKLLISILLSLLSLLFIFVSCTSQGGGLPQGTTAGEVPAGSDISPDETTADIESESTSEEVMTVPEHFETFAPELREELLQWLSADPGMVAYCERYPEIFDADLSYCVSSDVFESLIANLGDHYITFDELSKIIGKTHLRNDLKVSVVLYIWITSERSTYVFMPNGSLDHPEGLSRVEILLHYSKWHYFSGSKDHVTTTIFPSETTAEPVPG
jgi:hypothetical protein